MIRKNLPLILKDLNIDPALLLTAGADRSKNDTLTGLQCFPGKKATLYAPALFPGTIQNMSVCFTGPIVMKVSHYYILSTISKRSKGPPAYVIWPLES